MRNCVRVAQQTLTLFVWVRILVPQPKNTTSFDLSDFFTQADRLGISSRVSVYIINNGNAVVVSHHTEGVYFCRLDDMQNFVLMICNSCGIGDIQGFALIVCLRHNEVALQADLTFKVCCYKINSGDNMKIYQWLKIKKAYNQQIKKLPDEEVEKLIERTFDLYPQLIDIADGELRGKKGFWSVKLSDAFHNAEELNMPRSEEIDSMIWAVYGELHTKSIENFKKGIMTVSLLELSHNKISRRYIKSRLKDSMH